MTGGPFYPLMAGVVFQVIPFDSVDEYQRRLEETIVWDKRRNEVYQDTLQKLNMADISPSALTDERWPFEFPEVVLNAKFRKSSSTPSSESRCQLKVP